MSPLIITVETGEVDAFFLAIHEVLEAGAKSLLLLACDGNGFTSGQVDERLRMLPVPVFGGIFPQILVGSRRLERGAVVCGFPFSVGVHQIENLSDPNADYLSQVRGFANDIAPGVSVLTLVDGLGARISSLLESLYEQLGGEHPFIGGGAGSLSFVQKPCLFSNKGLLQDCAQITAIECSMRVAIEHGWHKFAGPFLVTGSRHNTIMSLNYRPAFEVYREIVEGDSGRRFSENEFFDLAKAYPFGVDRLNGDVVVRDPLLRDGDHLVCVGEVPENHMIYILKGEADHLLAASVQCARAATEAGSECVFGLLFDCISRTLFLQDRFHEELENIREQLPTRLPLLGALSLGEIANAGSTCLEFLNKTIVLGILGEKEGRGV